MSVFISKKNIKLGRIWNVSLPPIATCIPAAPCEELCYAMKAFRQYEGVRNAWERNLALWKDDPREFEASIGQQVGRARKPLKTFRWHVGGDIPDRAYFAMMRRIAGRFKDTKFLVFTKKYDIVSTALWIPQNLTVVLSGWPGLEMVNPLGLPVAWMQDGTETRVPDNALECPGHCDKCNLCWQLPHINRHVVFAKH